MLPRFGGPEVLELRENVPVLNLNPNKVQSFALPLKSCNTGEDGIALVEAVHGSAPDI